MHYDYTASKAFCEQISLMWLGDDFIKDADEEAFKNDFTQAQVDVAMRHMLWHVKTLFTPQTYPWLSRIKLALHFLFGKL